jgi:YD repeat-containing protein
LCEIDTAFFDCNFVNVVDVEIRRDGGFKMPRNRGHLLRWIFVFALCAASALGAIAVTHAANGSVAYSYDALGRVTTASYDTGVCIIYKYDPNGNRLSETISVTTTGTTGVWGCFNWNASGGSLWGT